MREPRQLSALCSTASVACCVPIAWIHRSCMLSSLFLCLYNVVSDYNAHGKFLRSLRNTFMERLWACLLSGSRKMRMVFHSPVSIYGTIFVERYRLLMEGICNSWEYILQPRPNTLSCPFNYFLIFTGSYVYCLTHLVVVLVLMVRMFQHLQ